jgi:DNA-binding response OmpR family regulator
MPVTNCVLLVEDEALLQMSLAEALQEGGFGIAVAPNGEEALEMLEAAGADYGALVTDVNLGGALTGWDVAKRAREIFSLLPVVYMTGAAASDWGANGVPNSVLVQKPFAPAQIVTAVAQLLNDVVPPPPAEPSDNE